MFDSSGKAWKEAKQWNWNRKTNWMENDADAFPCKNRIARLRRRRKKTQPTNERRKMRKYLVVTFFMLLMQNSCVFLMQDNFLHFYFVLFVRTAFEFCSFVKIFLQTFSILFEMVCVCACSFFLLFLFFYFFHWLLYIGLLRLFTGAM